jgi:hypothetical protein
MGKQLGEINRKVNKAYSNYTDSAVFRTAFFKNSIRRDTAGWKIIWRTSPSVSWKHDNYKLKKAFWYSENKLFGSHYQFTCKMALALKAGYPWPGALILATRFFRSYFNYILRLRPQKAMPNKRSPLITNLIPLTNSDHAFSRVVISRHTNTVTYDQRVCTVCWCVWKSDREQQEIRAVLSHVKYFS